MNRTTLQAIKQKNLLEELASGNEGTVYGMSNEPSSVYKEYKVTVRPTLDALALERLVELPNAMPPTDRQRVHARSLWPRTLVMDGAATSGFIMDRIDKRFYRRYGLASNPRNVLCEWNQLVYQGEVLPSSMVSDIPRLDVPETIRLISDLARTLETLHRHQVIVGDMSGRNLVWSPGEVLVIDCDGFRIDGHRGATEPKQSPGWRDETVGDGLTTRESDIYKLAIAAYRALWQEPRAEPDPALLRQDNPRKVPIDVVSLIAESLAPSGRPSAGDWVAGLDAVYRYHGRPVLTSTASADGSGALARPEVPPSTKTPAAAPTPRAVTRPRIQLP